MSGEFKIGELAADYGVSPDRVGFYERRGLLRQPQRTTPRHRVYDKAALERLKFIRGARGLGLTLDDINTLLRGRERRGSSASGRVLACLRARAVALDADLAKLGAFRSLLAKAIRLCEESLADALPILERLFASQK